MQAFYFQAFYFQFRPERAGLIAFDSELTSHHDRPNVKRYFELSIN